MTIRERELLKIRGMLGRSTARESAYLFYRASLHCVWRCAEDEAARRRVDAFNRSRGLCL